MPVAPSSGPMAPMQALPSTPTPPGAAIPSTVPGSDFLGNIGTNPRPGLNASDLNIAPERVDRRWLYSTIDARTRDGSTQVLGPVGGLWTKLDFGSVGAAGDVLEGVFTFPEQRGRGLAAELVASCMARSDAAVSLHVAEHNAAARRCYERAGMQVAGRCRLLLLG